MASNPNSYLLLDVGGTFIKCGAALQTGEFLPELALTLPSCSDGSREEIENALKTAVYQGVSALKQRGCRIAGIGAAVPGPFDCPNGISLMQHKFQSIYGLSMRIMLQGCPELPFGIPIVFVGDVNAALLGEMVVGNAAGYANAAVITLGTGIGFAYCIDSQVQYSPLGSSKRPIYRLPFGDRVLEDYASKRGILRVYRDIAGGYTDPVLTVADLGKMAFEGDTNALKTFETVGSIIAKSVHDLLAELKIECLLFGGQISKSFQFMEGPMRRYLSDLPLQTISTVRNLDDAALYGALVRLRE